MASASETSISSLLLSQNQRCIVNDHTLGSSPLNETNCVIGLRYPGISDEYFRIEFEQKLTAFKNMLITCKDGDDSFQGLAMIDAIQRLGIEYHFEEEINAILLKNYTMILGTHDNNNDFHEVALRFRLLRQHGYYVPAAGVFDNFKDEVGNFKEELSHDTEGLMSLYEASVLCMEGEDILDEARDHSYQLLTSLAINLDYPQAKAIENTLKHPQHKSLPKFMAKKFITNMQGKNGWMNELQEIAKFDFKMVQLQHQQEIVKISEWWKELGLSHELKFARDQPLKWYIWCMTALTDPSMSKQRIDLIKPISFVYLIDDIFDVYGSLDELVLFTKVVDR